MQNLKPWQIVLFVAAVGAVGVSLLLFLRADRPKLSHEFHMVDIRTGEMFAVDPSGKSIPVPARSPSTGERDLYPVVKDEAGAWIVNGRALEQIQAERAEAAEAINVETGEVTKVGDIRSIVPRDLLKIAPSNP